MTENLKGLNKAELLAIAKTLSIPNAARLKKSELILKIENAEQKSSRSALQKSDTPFQLKVKLTPRNKIPKESDFSHPYSETAMHVEGAPQTESPKDGELPNSYNTTKIVLMLRDPYWCYAYWDFSRDTQKQIDSWFRELNGAKAVLRIYDVTGREFNGNNANRFFDIDITLEARNWYIHVGSPDRNFLVDIGLVDKSGKFYLIARSNVIRTPRDVPSDVIDEEWMSRDFELFYAISGGFKVGISSGELVEKVKKGILFSSWVSSEAFSSRS